MRSRPRSPRGRAVGLFVLLAVFIGMLLLEAIPQYHIEHNRKRGPRWRNHPSFLIGDCPYYRATAISLLKDGDLDLRNNVEPRQYPPSSNVAQGLRGEWYPKHPMLMPLAALPFYALLRDDGLLLFNLVQLSALVMVMWFGARRYTSTGIASGLVLWYAFGTMLRATAYNFAPDLFSSLLVTGGIVALLYERAALSGVLLGFAVWSKWTNAAFLPIPVLYLAAHRDLRGILRYGIAASLPVLGLLAMNQHMFGSPFITPYDRVLVKHHGELVLEPSHRTFFNLAFWGGVWQQLTDKEFGLFMACPQCLLVPFGLVLLVRRSPGEALLIAAACAVPIATFAKYEQWRESSYGPRFLMTTLTLSALLVAPVLQRIFTGYAAGPAADFGMSSRLRLQHARSRGDKVAKHA